MSTYLSGKKSKNQLQENLEIGNFKRVRFVRNTMLKFSVKLLVNSVYFLKHWVVFTQIPEVWINTIQFFRE